MNSKSLLVAIAALAVTASGAQAFAGGNYLSQAGLSDAQTRAFSTARELRLKGKTDEARDLLLKVGIDEKAIEALREGAKEAHNAVDLAVENNDFTAFREATKNTPLYDIVNTEEDFAMFVEAQNLKAKGNFLETKGVLKNLGSQEHRPVDSQQHLRHHKTKLSLLSPEEQDALRVAKQANDQETVQEILNNAGVIEDYFHHKHH